MKYLFLFSLALCISCDSMNEHTGSLNLLPISTPEEQGMRSDSLAQIEALVQQYVDQRKIPGAVTLIAKNGRIIYESEIGFDDTLKTKPYQKHHLFRLASFTKSITTVAALQLVEQGKLNLDDPIYKFIPSFEEISVLDEFDATDTSWTTLPVNTPPTIHHLLTHTSGIPYAFMNPRVNGAMLLKNNIPDLTSHTAITMEEVADKLAEIPLLHQPGEKMTYGLNIDLIGRVIEVASGQDLASYLNKNILDPLEMDSTDFFFGDSYGSMLTTLYEPDTAGSYKPFSSPHPLYHPNFPVYGSKSHLSGGSGLTGTARDYFKFCQMVLNKGTLNQKELLKPETIDLMHTNQIDTLWNGKNKFSYGYIVQKASGVLPEGTLYFGGAFGTSFWIDPTNDLIIIQLRQVYFSPQGWELDDQMIDIIYNSFI